MLQVTVVPSVHGTDGRNRSREVRGVKETELFQALRAQGVDADDPQIRAAVRLVVAHVDDVATRHGSHTARRCTEAMDAALVQLLRHPDVEDMSSFEAAYDDEE